MIQKIIPGGAAYEDKRLAKDDKVLGVGQGENGEIVDVADMKLRDVVKLIRGKRGTIVRLKVLPAHATEPKIYNIVRAQVELTDSEARSQIIEAGNKPDGAPVQDRRHRPAQLLHGHGRLPRGSIENYKSCTRDVARLLEKFNNEKVDAVVLDLRRNGGGSLTESINLTGLFIDNGPVVQVKDSDKRVQQYDDRDRGMLWSGPLVVLTSKFSASASEIFAGAIQDYHRGLVVGDTSTHGKGTVQSLQDIGKDLFHVPNAQTARRAEDHDPAVLSPQRRQHSKSWRAGRRRVAVDHQPSRHRRIELRLRPQVRPRRRRSPIAPTTWSRAKWCRSLKANSAKRCEESKDFVKLAKKIARYERAKEPQEHLAQRKGLSGRAGRDQRRQGRGKGNRGDQRPQSAGFRRGQLLFQGNRGRHARLHPGSPGRDAAPATVGQSDRVPAGQR